MQSSDNCTGGVSMVHTDPRTKGRLVIVDHSEICNMDENKFLIVNRVRINSYLVELEICASENNEIIAIMRSAIRDMKRWEQANKVIALGAEMTVRDVVKVFGTMNKQPFNSFVAYKD